MGLFVVFRCDASTELGTGHVMRCLTLANTLEENGHDVRFCVNDQSLKVVPQLQKYGDRCLTLDEEGASVAVSAVSAAWPDGADWLVVDHYGYDNKDEMRFRPWARNILVIDDLANRPHDCDVILDQTIGRLASDYIKLVPKTAKVLVSSGYALLRPQFLAARPGALAKRERGDAPKRLMISLGGAASQPGLYDTILDGIEKTGLDLSVDFVLGHTSSGGVENNLKKRPRTFSLNILSGVDDMAALMVEADITIGAAGTTSWERCCLGLPSILIVLADNQNKIAHELEQKGAAVVAGTRQDLTSDKLADIISGLCENVEQLSTMGALAASICDGNGSQRVVDVLISMKN